MENKTYLTFTETDDFIRDLNDVYGIVILLDSMNDVSELRYLYDAYINGRHYETPFLNARETSKSDLKGVYGVKIELEGHDSENVNITVYQL